MPTPTDPFPSFLPENTRQTSGERYAAFERGESTAWQRAADEVWRPADQRLSSQNGSDRAIASNSSARSAAEDPYQLIFQAGDKVRAGGMTESAEADYRAAIALADAMNSQAVLNDFLSKQTSRSAFEARLIASQTQGVNGGNLEQLQANADKESYQLYRQYLAPGTTRSNMGLAYIGTGDHRMIAKGEQLIMEAIKLRPELQFNAEFQRHLLEAYGVMENRRMAAGLPYRPVGVQPVDYDKPVRTVAIQSQFNNHREPTTFDNPDKHLDAAKQSVRQNDSSSALQSFQKAIQAADRLSFDAILEDRSEVFRHRMCLDRDMTRAQARGLDTRDMYRQRQDLVAREWQLYQQYMAPATTRAATAFALIGSGNPQNIAQGQKLIQDAVKLRPEMEYTQEFRNSLKQAYKEAYTRNPAARPPGTTDNGVRPGQTPGINPETRPQPNRPGTTPGADKPPLHPAKPPANPGSDKPPTNPGNKPPVTPEDTNKVPQNPGSRPGSDFLPPTEDPSPKQPTTLKPDTPQEPAKQPQDKTPTFLPLPPEHLAGSEPQDKIDRDKLTETLKWLNGNPWALVLMTIAGYKLVKVGGKWLFKKRDGSEDKPGEGDKAKPEDKPAEDKTKIDDKTKSENKTKSDDKTKPEDKLSSEKEAEVKALKDELQKAEERLKAAKEATDTERQTMQKQVDDLKGKLELAEKEKLAAQERGYADRATFDKQAQELATKLQAAEQARQSQEQKAAQEKETLTKQVDELKGKLEQAEKDRLAAGEQSKTDAKALDTHIQELKQQLSSAQKEKAAQEERAATQKAAATKELTTIREQLETLRKEKQTAEDSSRRDKQTLEKQIAELQEAVKGKGELQGTVDDLQRKLTEAQQKKTAAEEKNTADAANFEQQLKELNAKLEEAGRKSSTADQAASQEKQKLGQQIQELQSKLEKVTTDSGKAAIEAQRESADLRQQLATAQDALQQAETKAAAEKAQNDGRIATMTKTIEQAEQIQKAAQEKAAADKAAFEKQLATTEQALTEKRSELAAAVKAGDANASKLDTRVKELEGQLATARGANEKSQTQMKAAQEDLNKQLTELRQQLEKAQQDKTASEQSSARQKTALDQQISEMKTKLKESAAKLEQSETKLKEAETKLKQQTAPNPAPSESSGSPTKAPEIADGHEVLPSIKMGQVIDDWKVVGEDGGDAILKKQGENRGLNGKELQAFDPEKFHKVEVKGESGSHYRRTGTEKIYKLLGVLTPSGQPMKDGPQFLVLVDGIEAKTPKSPAYRGLASGKQTTKAEEEGKTAGQKAEEAIDKAGKTKPGTGLSDEKAIADKQRVLNDLAGTWKEMQGQKVGEGYSQDVATIFEQTEALKGDSWTKEQRAQFDAMKAAYDKQKAETAGSRPDVDFINGFLNNPTETAASDAKAAQDKAKSVEQAKPAEARVEEKPVVTSDRQHSDQARPSTVKQRFLALETFVGPDGVRRAKPIPLGSLTVEYMEERIKVISETDIANAKKSGDHALAQEMETHRTEYNKRNTPAERRSYAEKVYRDYRVKGEHAGSGVAGKTALVSAGLVVFSFAIGDDSEPAVTQTPPVVPTGR